MTSREEYELESAIRGFHVYNPTWTPVIGEELTAERELGNSEDRFAVSSKVSANNNSRFVNSIFCWPEF